MAHLKNGFIQCANSLYAIPKLGLRILFPAALENKMEVIAIASNRLRESSGTCMRISKYRAYRFQTFDRECKIEGYGEGILCVMENVLKTLEPVYMIGKSKGKSDLVQVIEKQRTVKFILHRRVADRLKSCIHKAAKNRPLIKAVDVIKSRLTERCVTLSGDSKKLMEASKWILMKIIECTKPYWKKLPSDITNDLQQKFPNYLNNDLQQVPNDLLQQKIPDEDPKPNLPHPSESKDQIEVSRKVEGCLSFYSWLMDAGYSEDHVSAMHLAAMVNSQRLIVHKKNCSTGVDCECANPHLETSVHVRAKSAMNEAIDQIQSEITETKSYFSERYGPSFLVSGTFGTGKSIEEVFFKGSGLTF